MIKHSLHTDLTREQIYELLKENTCPDLQRESNDPYKMYTGHLWSYLDYDLIYNGTRSYTPTLRIKVTPREDRSCDIDLASYPDWFSELGFYFLLLLIIIVICFLQTLVPSIWIKIPVCLVIISGGIWYHYLPKQKIEKDAVQSFLNLLATKAN